MPGLVAALDSRPGVRVQRLSVHRDDWDEIPHRLTTDAGHVIRVDWFTIIPRHTLSVTTAGKEPIELLVVPPGTAEGTAQTAMTMAATSPGGAQPAAYPNGRALTNDVFSARMAFLASGKVGSGGLRPHEDLLAEFLLLGPPDP